MKPVLSIMTAALLAVTGVAHAKTDPVSSDNTIQLALLLDTSNSMDGLINQAKARLWNVVNTLTTLKYHGQPPKIEIALYEYGNDGLPKSNNWVRQVAPLTQDLDLISEKLFALKTNGGEEYVGAVITQATQQLKWSTNDGMRLIYVAGNEPFNQGGVSYKEAIAGARQKDIYINTIYCGDAAKGIGELWKDGADRGLGKYFSISSDETVQHIDTPYDRKLSELNESLNKTYIGYGSLGAAGLRRQKAQDANASSVSLGNSAERAVSKSKISAYDNATWDLIDQYKKDDKVISKLQKADLAPELQGKTEQEITAVVQKAAQDRAAIQKEIASVANERQVYIDKVSKERSGQNDLGKAISQSLLDLAKQKGYKQ